MADTDTRDALAERRGAQRQRRRARREDGHPLHRGEPRPRRRDDARRGQHPALRDPAWRRLGRPGRVGRVDDGGPVCGRGPGRGRDDHQRDPSSAGLVGRGHRDRHPAPSRTHNRQCRHRHHRRARAAGSARAPCSASCATPRRSSGPARCRTPLPGRGHRRHRRPRRPGEPRPRRRRPPVSGCWSGRRARRRRCRARRSRLSTTPTGTVARQRCPACTRCSSSPPRRTRSRLAQHRNVVEAAAAAGVQHVVYTSFVGASPTCTFTLGRDHYATEQLIRDAG